MDCADKTPRFRGQLTSRKAVDLDSEVYSEAGFLSIILHHTCNSLSDAWPKGYIGECALSELECSRTLNIYTYV